jgi:hypothetical protein
MNDAHPSISEAPSYEAVLHRMQHLRNSNHLPVSDNQNLLLQRSARLRQAAPRIILPKLGGVIRLAVPNHKAAFALEDFVNWIFIPVGLLMTAGLLALVLLDWQT